jgi:hypothetical protein
MIPVDWDTLLAEPIRVFIADYTTAFVIIGSIFSFGFCAVTELVNLIKRNF